MARRRSSLALLALAAGAAAEEYTVYEQKTVSAIRPSGRALATAVLQFSVPNTVVSGQFVWLFGGMDGVDDSVVYNDLWLYTVATGAWTQKSAIGITPQRRRGATMVGVHNQRAYLWGGSHTVGETPPAVPPESATTMWMLDMSRTSPRWQITTLETNATTVTPGVTSSGAFPMSRMRHTATIVQMPEGVVAGAPEAMVVFGGQSPSRFALNDVHAFRFVSHDPPQGRWYTFSPAGQAPAARIGHSACNALDSLVVFGGTDPQASPPVKYGDVHILNLVSNRWSSPMVVGANTPAGREGHTMMSIGSKVYIFGGVNHAGDILDDLWSFSAYSAVAGQLVWQRPIPMSGAPPARWGHLAVPGSF